MVVNDSPVDCQSHRMAFPQKSESLLGPPKKDTRSAVLLRDYSPKNHDFGT